MRATAYTFNESRGIKLFKDGKHLKTIPSKFQKVCLSDFINNTKQKRPTKYERFLLEVNFWIKELSISEPLVYKLVVNQKIKEVRKVKNFYKTEWFEMVLENNHRVRIPDHLYNKCPIRNTEPIYIN